MDIADHASPWTVFLETVEPDSGMLCLPEFDKESMCFHDIYLKR